MFVVFKTNFFDLHNNLSLLYRSCDSSCSAHLIVLPCISMYGSCITMINATHILFFIVLFDLLYDVSLHVWTCHCVFGCVNVCLDVVLCMLCLLGRFNAFDPDCRFSKEYPTLCWGLAKSDS